MSTTDRAVVAGVDGSAETLRAVRLAAQEAERRNCPLRLVHAFIWPLLRVPVGPPPGGPPGAGLQRQAEQMIAQATEVARATVGELDVQAEIVTGQPAPVLVGQARQAALLVLGDRGLGPVTSLLAGSVPIQVCGYVDCPVLVDRGRQPAAGPVVVGINGSPSMERAIGFAAEEAMLRGVELIAVHALSGRRRTPTGRNRSGHDQSLTESLARWQTRYPGLRVSQKVVDDRVTRTLRNESARAGLLVVGTLARSSLAGLVFGSVSQQLLWQSDCPVAIVGGGRQNRSRPAHATRQGG